MTPEARNSRKTPQRHDGVVDTLGEHLRQRTPSPAEEQVALDRIWTDLREQGHHLPADVPRDFQPAIQPGIGSRASACRAEASGEGGGFGLPGRPRRIALATAAGVVILLSAALVGYVMSTPPVQASVEAIDGTLYRVSGSDARVIATGDRVRTNEILRTNGGAGAQLALTDGSRVEMRSQSELSVERANDGVRIRLSKGGIIVNAAKQRTGRLYVQTKDVTVAVVGTVFLVDVEEQGSRVAVLEGEVRVQQGTVEKKLLPGEQLATNPLMEAPPLSREISWSRRVDAHRVQLQQSAAAPASGLAKEGDRFEEISVRPASPGAAGGGGRGGGPIRSRCSELFLDTARDGSIIWRVQIDPSRFAVARTTLYTLIAWAYGKDCRAMSLGDSISGGPGWVRSEEWDIHALIPEGSPSYTVRQFVDGNAPGLQARLRHLLESRFQLVVRTEMRESPVYVLALGDKPLKLRPRLGPTGPGVLTGGTDELGGKYGILMNVPESNFAGMLMSATGRVVLDRTGIKDGRYLDLEYAPFNGAAPSSRPSLFTALEEVGLKLTEAKVPLETLVIEHVERATEN